MITHGALERDREEVETNMGDRVRRREKVRTHHSVSTGRQYSRD